MRAPQPVLHPATELAAYSVARIESLARRLRSADGESLDARMDAINERLDRLSVALDALALDAVTREARDAQLGGGR